MNIHVSPRQPEINAKADGSGTTSSEMSSTKISGVGELNEVKAKA